MTTRKFRTNAAVRGGMTLVEVLVVMIIYNVLLAVISNFLFAKYSPEYFGNPFTSLFTIFQIFTVEGWNDVTYSLIVATAENKWLSSFVRIYFTIIVLSGGIFGVSIVNAIFVDEMMKNNNDDLEDKIDELNYKVNKLLEEINSKK